MTNNNLIPVFDGHNDTLMRFTKDDNFDFFAILKFGAKYPEKRSIPLRLRKAVSILKFLP